MACDLKNAKQGDKDTQLKVGGSLHPKDLQRPNSTPPRRMNKAKATAFSTTTLKPLSGLSRLLSMVTQEHSLPSVGCTSRTGVPQDYSKAMRWLHKASAQGFEVAQLEAGHSYRYEGKCLHDDSKTFQWLLTTAEHRNRDAQLLVANLYENEVTRKYMGQVVPQDNAEAIQWYLRAAKQGNKCAQHKVAEWYEYGRGVFQDDTKAMMRYIKQAEHGDDWGIYYVAERYEIGGGVPLNRQKTLEWYNKAVQDVFTARRNPVGGLVQAAWEKYTHIDNPNTLSPARGPQETRRNQQDDKSSLTDTPSPSTNNKGPQAPQDHVATTGAKDITQKRLSTPHSET
ncbi:MAG: hypothetical protein J3R72DRAFT_492950 [Linnemannia gamsii]|nr:MAG: hypothetical protein J3R72DRAFT_492950 [Linnemannia gamsii]